MNHNAFPVWQVATTEQQTTRGGITGTQNNGGSISALKYVTNARPNVKIISIPGRGAGSNNTDGTLLYETSIDGSYLTVTKDHQQQQQQQPVRRTTANHNSVAMLNDSILLKTPDGQEYLVDERSIQNIDQIPPENLIYMTSSDVSPLVSDVEKVNPLPAPCLSTASEQNQLELGDYVDPTAAADQTPQLQTEYAEECQVTEEVITDDWVQSQGEECVQVTVDQLGVNTITVEDEIPVPLDQDQYTLSRPYPCDFCSRRFRKKASLQNHLMAHSNDRPHMCNLCGAQYGRRSDLINHLKQHAYAGTEQDDLSLRGDQDADCTYKQFNHDLPELTNTAGHLKHRTRQSSEDEDLYIQNAMVSYNSQPPMQLISTTNYGSSSATISSSYEHSEPMERTSFGNGPTEDHSTMDIGYSSASLPTNSAGKRMSRKRQNPTSDMRPARTKLSTLSTKATTQVRSSGASRTNVSSNRPIKKEPNEHSENINVPAVETVFPVIDERKPFVCQQCGTSFGREKALLAHSRTHANRTQHECDYCYAQFYEWSQLQEHVRRTHQTNNSLEHSKSVLPVSSESKSNLVPDHETYDSGGTSGETKIQYNCDKCSAAFFQLEHMLNHKQQKHGVDAPPRKLVVKQELIQTTSHNAGYDDLDEEGSDQEIEEDDYGDYTIEQYENRSSDQETNPQHPTTAFTCRECGDSFANGMELLEHSETHNRYEPHECQLCGEKFLDEATIKLHVQESHRDELTATSCAICGKRCKSQTTLIKHAWDHSRERTHSCSQCGKTFHHMTRLKRHMESHRNKTVRCEVCNQAFPDGRTLMNHRHSHTKSNEYPCHECGKTFGSRSSQQIHMRIHTGERPYACRFCWKAFADGGTLRKHERIHTGEKPYACPVCPKAFNQRVVLREHIRAHHSQADAKRGSPNQPYYCSVCSAPFSTTDDLVQHLIKHSDMNTAMKREPPTFPRKYKRRRKLKPHELERLQSGRRKQKNKPSEELDDDDGDDAGFDESISPSESSKQQQHESKPSIVLSHPDGTLKTKRELNLEYGRRGSKPSSSPHGILDENGINLLSNIVLLHGQQGEPSNTNDTHPRMLNKKVTLTGETNSKEKAGPSTLTNAPKSKVTPVRKKPSRKRPAGTSLTMKDSSDSAVKMKDEERSSPPSTGSTMTNVMEAFFRSRKRNALLPEIPSHRISSVSFPLLDDGNTDDPMDEPMVMDDGCRRGYTPQQQRKSTTSFSASEDDLTQQLLMEITHKNKYTDRFNSDTVHDLEEILRSPIKGASSRNMLSTTPSTKRANHKQEGKPLTQRKQKGKSKAKNKKPVSVRPQQKPAEKKIKKLAPEIPPAVLRSQRLTRRQLEREVNFLKEAYEGSATGTELSKENDSSSGVIVPSEVTDTVANADNDTPSERMDSSERLAAMLLNDGLQPDDTQSSNDAGTGDSSCHGSIFQHEDHFASTKAYAESLHMMEFVDAVKQEDKMDEENVPGRSSLYTDKTTITSQNADTTGAASNYRCSICAACFDDRAQLILHVPVHI
uniref:C2H2-type domain-containing protein n=1 Tax=Anopheles minimus TaxID=112268 RepID=A0A182WGC9_9DIPT